MQVAFEGLDGPVLPETPDFAKALDIDHARDGEVMLAWAMNGEDLPWLNGYPAAPRGAGLLRHLLGQAPQRITVLDKPFEGFWMKSAYRIPDNACACTEPGKAPAATVPIGRFNIRSFLTNLLDGARVKAGATRLRGIAFDGGYGITDGRGLDRWRHDLDGGEARPGSRALLLPALDARSSICRPASTPSGSGRRQPDRAVQPMEPRWNPPGYMRNVVETTGCMAA